MGKLKDDGLGNVPSSALSPVIFLLFNCGSLRHSHLFHPPEDKEKQTNSDQQKTGWPLEPSRGQWLPDQGEMNVFEDSILDCFVNT